MNGIAKELSFDEFPHHGHMLVVSKRWDAVYWFPDRKAVIRGGSVELEGPTDRLLEARSDDHGLVTFERVREHKTAEVSEEDIAHAVAMLTDPEQVEETLYPPYIRDVTKRPKRPYLQHPDGLIWRDAVVLDREFKQLHWLWVHRMEPDDSIVFTAPVYGAVQWGQSRLGEEHPDWVDDLLFDHLWAGMIEP